MADIDCFANLMKPENLKALFGDNPPPQEALRQMAKDIETLKKLSADDPNSFQSKLQAYVKDVAIQKQIEKGLRAADLRKARNVKEFMLQKSNYDNPVEALKSMLSGNTTLLSIGGRDSVFGRVFGLHNQVISKLVHGLEDSGLMKIAQSGALDGEAKQVMEALNLGNEMPKVSEQGKAYGQILHDIYKFMLVQSREADIPVRNLPGFSGPIKEDLAKMHATPFEEWAGDVRKAGIDKEKTFGVHAGDQKAEDKILKAIYDGKKMGFGAADSAPPKIDEEVRDGISYSRKLSEKRLLRFSNSDAETQYLQKYGKGTVLEMVTDDLGRKSRMIGMVSKLGANPEAGLTNAIDTMIDQYKKDNRPDLALALGKGRRPLENIMHLMTNRGSIPGLNTQAQVVDGILFSHVMSKLAWSGMMSLPNLGVAASTLRSYTGSGVMENIARIGMDWLKGFPAENREFYARQAGFAISDTLPSAVGQGGSMFGALGRGFSYLSKNIMKLNGMDFVNSMQFHFARYFMQDVAEAATKDFKSLHPLMQSGMLMAGIEEKDFQFLQHAIEQMPDGRQMVTPEAISKLDPKMVTARAAEKGLSASAYINDLKAKYFGTILHGMTDSTTSSTWRERAITTGGADKGSYERSIRDLLFQFKQFLVQAGNIGLKVANSNPDVAALQEGQLTNSAHFNYSDTAKMMAATTLMGGLALTMKGHLRSAGAATFDATNKTFHTAMGWSPPLDVVRPGKENPSPASMDFWIEAMNKGGTGGVFMDALLGDHDVFPYAESVLGPTLGPMASVGLGEVARLRKGLQSTIAGQQKPPGVHFFEDKKSQTAFYSDLGRVVKQNMPFGQLPLVEQSLNYAYYNILKEWLSPGYVYRRQVREQQAKAREER